MKGITVSSIKLADINLRIVPWKITAWFILIILTIRTPDY